MSLVPVADIQFGVRLRHRLSGVLRDDKQCLSIALAFSRLPQTVKAAAGSNIDQVFDLPPAALVLLKEYIPNCRNIDALCYGWVCGVLHLRGSSRLTRHVDEEGYELVDMDDEFASRFLS